MFELSPGTWIELLAVIGLGAFALWRGYSRRRLHWSRRSWISFGFTVATGLALIGFTLTVSVAVDNHASWVGATRSGTRAAWTLAALASLVGGSFLTAGSLMWFARGEPSRPFSFAGFVAQARLHVASNERGKLVDGTRSRKDS